MSFKFPHKPGDMTLAEWGALCCRHEVPICENKAAGTCSDICGLADGDGLVPLQVDHIQSRACGGETSARNCRLICANGGPHANQNRGAATDPYWQRDFWFDRLKSFDQLRRTQRVAGPNTIWNYRRLFVEPLLRDRLLRTCSLFILTTGAGKTVLQISLLLAINQVVLRILGKAPRIGRLLWFVSERELAQQLAVELRKEIEALGLHSEPPRIRLCTEKGDLEGGPGGYDITIACPHALWQRKNQERSNADIEQALAKYDAIVWDECDFAPGQVDRLIGLARHAIKFGQTATPIDGAGTFLRLFTVAAVASYKTVFEQDKCLKIVPEWDEGVKDGYIKAAPHSAFISSLGGKQEQSDGVHGDNGSLPGANAAIRMAIEDSYNLERRMKNEDDLKAGWFSPHLIVRCAGIAEAVQLAGQTEQFLAGKQFPGHGWRTAIIYAPNDRHPFTTRLTWENGRILSVPLEPCEKQLIDPAGRLIHPWMRAKELYSGRCDDAGCARILFVVDKGRRGLNNWTCAALVDIARQESISNQCQLRGRMDRLPKHLAWILEQRRHDLYPYITTRYYYPEAGHGHASMKAAYNFLHAMDESVAAANLATWEDLLGDDDPDVSITPQPQETGQPFTLGDRLAIDAALGEIVEEGGGLADVREDIIDAIVKEELRPEATPERRQKAKAYARLICDDEEFRDQQVTIDPPTFPVRVVEEEMPMAPEQFGTDELIDYARSSPKYKGVPGLVGMLRSGNETVKTIIANAKHEDVARHYTRPIKLLSLNPCNESKATKTRSVMTELCGPLERSLHAANIFSQYSEVVGMVRRYVRAALVNTFGEGNPECSTENDGPLDTPAYHYKMLSPRVQNYIRETAVRMMRRDQQLGPASVLYRKRK